MTSIVIFAFGLSFFVYAVAKVADVACDARVEIRCRCGAKSAVVTIIEDVDILRLSDTMSENCPGCLSAIARTQRRRALRPESAVPKGV